MRWRSTRQIQHDIDRELRRQKEEAEWAERHKHVSDDEVQKELEEVEGKLAYLKGKVPDWKIRMHSTAYREIRGLEKEREAIVVELSKRDLPKPPEPIRPVSAGKPLTEREEKLWDLIRRGLRGTAYCREVDRKKISPPRKGIWTWQPTRVAASG